MWTQDEMQVKDTTQDRAGWRTVGALTAAILVALLGMTGVQLASMSSFPFPIENATSLAFLSSLHWFVGAPLLAYVATRFRPRSSSWPVVLLVHLGSCAVLVGAGVWTEQFLEHGHLEELTEFESTEELDQFLGAFRAMVGEREVDILSGLEQSGPFFTTEGAPMMGEMYFESQAPEVSLSMLLQLPTFVALMMMAHALLAFAELKDRKVQEARLRGELSVAQLAALRMQVQPHFLFNTLNSVNALMGSDVDRARKMLADLASLLRVSFQDGDAHEIKLGAELELVQKYAQIQGVRFGERLALEVDAPQDLLDAHVPALALQPIVENSIIHGVERSTRPVQIRIRAWREGDDLRIAILDDGPGSSQDGTPGIGLKNTSARLTEMYGDRASLDAGPIATGGFEVQLKLPFHTTPAGSASDA